MITEDYVSYGVARLLKDKGFDESIETLIRPDGVIYRLDDFTITNSEIKIYSDDVCCPTLQMARKWLSDVHNIFISISIGYVGRESRKTYMWMPCICKSDHIEYPTEENFEAPSEEEAIVDALRYCLEHLI